MKISIDERIQILQLYATGKYSFRKIGQLYGVSGTAIRNIIRDKYPALVYNWSETNKEKRLRSYAEFYEKKAKHYRDEYNKSFQQRLQRSFIL